MSKKLTLSAIDKAHTKEFNQQKRITLSTGDYLDIDVKFKSTSIQRLLLDLQEILEQLKSKNVNVEVMRDISFIYHMLILRHFSSLNNIPNDIEKMILVCEKLIDLGVLEEIMNHFDAAELEKINTMMKKVSENSTLIGEQLGEIFAKAALNDVLEGDSIANVQQP